MSAKRFRIAFSFAGEKRDFVSQVAGILSKQFGQGAILYDKYHEAEFARRDLGIYLPDLYHKESDLVIVVVCPSYDVKQWTGLEWTAIHDLLSHRKHEEIMLCRFASATVTGLYSTAGFVELDHKTPDQAATLILERLALNEGHPKDHYKTGAAPTNRPAKTSIPNNLPRLQPFFGREEELKTIREALDSESRTWGALIDGPGGMGKTSLAVRAAYDCPPGQFQRIIFLSVKDRELDDDGVRQVGSFILPGFLEMLNELARELRQPDITKAPEDQRIRLLLDALRPTQALLILDNLESLPKDDRDQLFTFVKRLPQGCKAILTSRRRLGSGSELLILDKLDQATALETLADLARHIPLLAKTSEAERITLYQQTGGKPLLLRWVAGQLGRGSCRTLTGALNFVCSCPKDNDPLEFIFGDLVEKFTGEETKVLCALTFFTLSVKVQHIAELAGLNEESVKTALCTLANRSLVVPDQEEKSHALVPMVAVFLRRKRPEIVAETGSRLEQRAYKLIIENGYGQHNRFELLDANWPIVAPALPLFLTGPNDRLQSVCAALVTFLEYTGRWDEWLSLEQQAEAKAVSDRDYSNAGWRAKNLAYVSYLRGQAEAVLNWADRAMGHWQTAQAGACEYAMAIRLRGLGYGLKQDYRLAITAFLQALDLVRTQLPKSEAVAKILNDLGEAQRYSGDLDASERYTREALEMARALNYTEGEAYSAGNLAELSLDRQQWAQAETLAREALSLSEILNREVLIARSCYCLAASLLGQGKHADAQRHAQLAVEVFTRLGSPKLVEARPILDKCAYTS